MTRAISIAFRTTFHRLFIWHITSKFSVKLPHSAYKEYWRDFQKAIWDTDNKDEFDAKWNIVVTKAGLTDHPWLSSMFDLRKSWVLAYARQVFAVGMSSSQRAEELKTEDASKVVFNVSERKNWETRVAEVVYVKDSDHASCSCKRFEFVGIICKHILALFRRDQIEYMPNKYILKRWKKTAKSGLVSDANGNEIKDSADPGLLIKWSTMSRLASDVVEDALMSEEGCELLSETLKSLQVKLKLLKDGPSNNEVGWTSPSNNDESTPIDRSDPLFDEFDRMHGPTE
ncbi:protein FAR1-RELATED SEQUENCE 7-like [Prunus persica]|uniref:protein FAR1-RELATED SEQUENCE 7-like n=1 Tax=Prunus persica TaxID=3760 RepID=UPI0009ABA93A|nr:protein FAR1-RELATED SEQUENCE 7-like [Prunus persica]